jgi:general stress protein 26
MSDVQKPQDHGLRDRVLAVLDENRLMSVATLRADGWPQTTLVGYAHDDLRLYFVVARKSQKLANIERDPRVSIALGGHSPDGRVRGLSMAAKVFEVTEVSEIVRLNELVLASYPEQALFAPRAYSSAVLRAEPSIISLVDDSTGHSEPQVLHISD